MDVAKYRALFVTESREHLDGISNALLALEKNPSDRAALDDLFRRAHSIKGMAASMGYEPVALLSHKLEDLADLARRTSSFDADAVQIWLEGGDALGEMVVLVEAGREAELQLPPLMDRVMQKSLSMLAKAPVGGSATFPRMAAVTPPSATTTQPGMPVVQDPAVNATMLLPAVQLAPPPVVVRSVTVSAAATNATVMIPAVGSHTWDMEVRIGEGSTTPHVRAFLVHKRVTEKMELVSMVPPLAEVRQGTLPGRVLKMRLKGPLDGAALTALVKGIPDVADVQVQPVVAPSVVGPAKTVAVDAAVRTVRVRTELLDELIDSVGEILLARSRLRTVASRLEDPALADLADEFARLAKGLHDRVMTARMTPVSVLSDRLPRVVRDLAKKRGRDVMFEVEGGSIELDRAILDELHDPVLHLVRNAVDHAHDGPQARQAAGKSPVMSLILAASRDRDHVLIELKDDGRGMDPARLRKSAVEKGLLTADAAAALDDQQALELICRAGFSTAEEVNDTSGRGVGMDVVRSKVEQLGGQLLIQSTLGKGTTFTMRLPLTVAIIRVLLVGTHSGDAVYALPLHRVDHALDFLHVDVVHTQDGPMYPVGETLAPLHDLPHLLGFHALPERSGGAVVVVERSYRHLAVRVDRIMGQQEVVVKPLGAPLATIPWLSGAALLADGRPAYILDIAKLVDGLQSSTASQEQH